MAYHLKKHLLVVAACAALGCFSCGETNRYDSAELTGRWVLQAGYIDDKQNDRLNGTEFVFHPEGTMETNLPLGFDGPVPFAIEGNNLLQKGEQTFRYVIESLSDSSLVLRTELRGTHFRFEMRPEAPVEETAPEDAIESEATGDSIES